MRIFFDVDGVLINNLHAVRGWIKRWDENIEKDLGIKQDHFQEIFKSWFPDVLCGRLDLEEELERWLLPAACLLCDAPVAPRDGDALVCALCRSRWRTVPGPLCDRCGQPTLGDLACRLCADWTPGLRRVRSAVWLDESARLAVHRLKYEGWWRVAESLAEAMRAYEEGLGTADDIDAGARIGLNHPMGPLELADFIGLDVVLGIMRVLDDGIGGDRFRPPKVLMDLVAAGNLGYKVKVRVGG